MNYVLGLRRKLLYKTIHPVIKNRNPLPCLTLQSAGSRQEMWINYLYSLAGANNVCFAAQSAPNLLKGSSVRLLLLFTLLRLIDVFEYLSRE